MKKIVKILILAAVAFFTAEATADAQLLKNILNNVSSSSTVSAATSNGRQAGAALKSLYTQYKADGKLDMNNLNNMLNLATLASSVKDLKGQTSKTTFYKEFAAGLITGSNNLVTSSNSTSVMNGLTSLVNNVDLSSLAQGSTGTTANATEIASSVSNILKIFKK